MPTELDSTTAREHFAEVINRVAYGHEQIILTRRGQPLAAVIPIRDFTWFCQLEDADDLREALALGDEPPTDGIPLEKVKAHLQAQRRAPQQA